MARESSGPIDVRIGRHLRALRVAASLSEERVAQELGVSQQLVSRQERGDSRLSIAQLLRLAALYGRTLAQLMVEMALDHPAPYGMSEPEATPYEAAPAIRGHSAEGEFAREPFLLNLAQLRDPMERQAVLDLFKSFVERQSS